MKGVKKGEMMQCPACKQMSFVYDDDLSAYRCQDEFCRWTDKVTPAIDVPIGFLKYCLGKVEPGPKKDKIKVIIEKTEAAQIAGS